MSLATPDLWTLTSSRPQLDPIDLAEAIAVQLGEEQLDYRTRQLICESAEALKGFWGKERFENWLAGFPLREKLAGLLDEHFDKVGFPSLRRRLMNKTKPEQIRQFLEHAGRLIHRDVTVYIAESGALILTGYLSRNTEDVDLIDEVPQELRENHQALQELQDLYGLHFGHVQSHYFPSGWVDRVHSLGSFGRLKIFVLDAYDVLLSKLFSIRIKDMGDMRVLLPQLDQATLATKVKDNCQGFLAGERLRQIAQDNWQILFGEPLPQ